MRDSARLGANLDETSTDPTALPSSRTGGQGRSLRSARIASRTDQSTTRAGGTASSRVPYARQRDAVWSLACGVSGGVALWMHPLAVWYLSAAALALLARVRGARWLTIAGCGVAGFVVGGLPIWIFNLQTGGATFRFVLGGTQGQTADRAQVLAAWWNNDLPRGAGLWHPWGPSPLRRWRADGAGRRRGRVVGSLRPTSAGDPSPGRGAGACWRSMPTLFVLSGFGGPALNPCGFDATGRYTPPIWSGLAVVLGAALAGVWRFRRWLAVGCCLLPLGRQPDRPGVDRPGRGIPVAVLGQAAARQRAAAGNAARRERQPRVDEPLGRPAG